LIDSWHHVLCAHDEGMRSREDIHEDVYQTMKERLQW
jgi:hypothetical protein